MSADGAQREPDAHAGGQAQGVDQSRVERIVVATRRTPFSMPRGMTLYWNTALVGSLPSTFGLDGLVADPHEREPHDLGQLFEERLLVGVALADHDVGDGLAALLSGAQEGPRPARG